METALVLTAHPQTRKAVWRAAQDHYRRYGVAYNLTDLQVRIARPGLVVFETMKSVYCDGRSKVEEIASDRTERRILAVFIQDLELEPTTES